MSAPQGEYVDNVKNCLFSTENRLQVGYCCLFLCSVEGISTVSSWERDIYGDPLYPNDDFCSTHVCKAACCYCESVGERQGLVSNRAATHAQRVPIPTCAREISKRRSDNCEGFSMFVCSRYLEDDIWDARWVGGDSVSIPDHVVSICDRCFHECKTLCRLTFGASSKLERIGTRAFRETSIESLCIPDSVVVLCDRPFYDCERIQCVTFGASS